MVPALSRRRLLAATGTLLGGLAAGRALTTPGSSGNDPGDGWPMAQHDPAGRSYAPAASPPTDGVSVRWKHRLTTDLGFDYGVAPVVADGRVYAAGRRLLALDAATGAVDFRADRDLDAAPAVAPARAYRSPTLAVSDASSVTGLHANGGLDVLGSQRGLTRWEVPVGSQETVFVGGTPPSVPTVAASGTVFGSTGGRLVAVDASSGRVRWQVNVDAQRPAVHRGTVYVAAYPFGVRGYDVETGDQQFEAQVSGATAISVTAGPERLVVATDEGLAGLSYDGDTRWRFAPGDLSRDHGAVALAEGVAYAGFRGEDDNPLVAVDAATGEERWRSPAAPEASPRFAPPAVADGVVYLPLEDEGLAAVDARDGHVRWRFGGNDERRPWSPVALAGETLYAVGNGHVYALEEA
ncbi:outer membrane protein assembly factor BamB family protein [Halomicrococcus gelatinilyticus]|uniref:outer membrane protein assembly factor BamB family protein n=1 Tax=Halomicrococcus gelatinilyticus TaxID=1702103 RepID=UPI002E1281EC